MLPAMCLGNLGFCVALALGGTSAELYPGDLLPMLALGLLVLPVALTLTTLGSSLLPSAESSLLLCIETVCSPIMAAWVVGDHVSTRAWIGLAIVVAALVGHAICPE